VVPTSKDPVTFPVLGDSDEPVLVWLAAHSALELHTPQWRVDAQVRPLPPDRLVIDLDPGPDVGLPQCCETALVVRDLLAADGLSSRAVLSGSKGLHLYAAVDGSRSSDEVTDYVQDVGRRCGAQLPDLVVVTMAKQARVGRVFLDWSQNRAAKTTLAPWSLRGTTLPNAALPVSWTEVAEGGLRQVTLDEALERLAAGSVPLPWEQP
jgi:bifunctional non-homologous end joining protein LigD